MIAMTTNDTQGNLSQSVARLGVISPLVGGRKSLVFSYAGLAGKYEATLFSTHINITVT